MLRASVVEVNKLETRIPFLATTASIAPFIGLFGTVMGIMNAFERIGADRVDQPCRRSAPGIAEALIATAAGLAAAIPAVLFYNHLAERVKLFASEMDDFAMEFLNIARGISRRCRSCGPAASSSSGADGRGRRVIDLARRDQRRAAGRRDAGAADHLHGDRADDPARHRRETAAVARARRRSTGERRRGHHSRHDCDSRGWCSSARNRFASKTLQERVRQRMETARNKEVFLRGDAGVQYQDLMNVIDALKAAGVQNIGMVARMPERAVMDVSDVLRDRMRTPAGLQRMVSASVAVHLAVAAALIVRARGFLKNQQLRRR